MIESLEIDSLLAEPTLAVLEITPHFDGSLPAKSEFRGVVRGPYSPQSRTLPAEYPIVDDGDGRLLARIVDPCYATQELHMEYEVEIFIFQADETISTYKSILTLRQKSN